MVIREERLVYILEPLKKSICFIYVIISQKLVNLQFKFFRSVYKAQFYLIRADNFLHNLQTQYKISKLRLRGLILLNQIN
jgi:hypothetical protein